MKTPALYSLLLALVLCGCTGRATTAPVPVAQPATVQVPRENPDKKPLQAYLAQVLPLISQLVDVQAQWDTLRQSATTIGYDKSLAQMDNILTRSRQALDKLEGLPIDRRFRASHEVLIEAVTEFHMALHDVQESLFTANVSRMTSADMHFAKHGRLIRQFRATVDDWEAKTS